MTETPTLSELTRVFGRIGLLSFGGPAAQIALMHRELVDERPWLTEKQYLSALSFCMLLPGPEAMQLATYAGWRLHGVTGGLIAGGLFVLPGAVVVLGLAMAYAFLGDVPLVAAVFLGIKAAVVIIVIDALIKVSKRALKTRTAWVIAALSFLGIFALNLSFPLIIAAAALWGLATARGTAEPVPLPSTAGTLRTAGLWATAWAAPIAALWASGSTLLTDIAVFFSKLAVVTFGGAYAVLAYMTQEVVLDFGWLSTPQMMDGLGLAETTPGPLILVTEFVGFLAGFQSGGLGLGIAAALVTLWVTFIPCFLWIFVGAPYVEWISGQPRLTAALDAITAAVVGVILNLYLWFALHLFFGDLRQVSAGPLIITASVLPSLVPTAVGLSFLAAVLLLWLRWSLLRVLIALATAGGLLGVFL